MQVQRDVHVDLVLTRAEALEGGLHEVEISRLHGQPPVEQRQQHKVRAPAGVGEGFVLRLPGQGHDDGDGPAGDACIHIVIAAETVRTAPATLTLQRKGGLSLMGLGAAILAADLLWIRSSLGEPELHVAAEPLAMGFLCLCFGLLLSLSRVSLGGNPSGRRAFVAIATAVVSLTLSIVGATQLAFYIEHAGYHWR